MEFVELASEASWSSFYDPTMAGGECQVIAQLFDVHNFSQDQQTFWSDRDAESCYSLDAITTTFTSSSTPAYVSIGGDKITTPSFHAGAYHQLNESLLPSAHANASALQTIKRRLGVGDAEVPIEEDDGDDAPMEPVTKKRKISDEQSKKAKKSVGSSSEEESNSGNSNPQSSCCYSSEDGSSSKGSNGKKTASPGSATDPQSLYARKRRERINERLRILQNLVPNGTKVDISTMLEEAVQYVKFLQLQIKLLSSDELWMYAPIAYNAGDVYLAKLLSSILDEYFTMRN